MAVLAKGWGSGLLGVIIFSGSLPATRVAVASFSPLFLTSARVVIAAALGAVLLTIFRERVPSRSDLGRLAVIAVGVVVGFPLLTALALQHITSAHSIVYIGLLPLATATFAVLRGGERPKPIFWLFSSLGSLTVVGFAILNSDAGTYTGDLLMIGAIVLCGLGYAEGGALSRTLGGWQVISWALLLSMPIFILLGLLTWPVTFEGVLPSAWIGLVYVSVFSMMVGFVFWYRGLALGGAARVGQLQLLQPFMALALAGLLLREPVPWTMFAATGFVILCVAGAKRFG
jgi:drug/metabolite transporter (DMT)-like permease